MNAATINASTRQDHAHAPLLGDHLALDLLNTEARRDGDDVDYWRDGGDVRIWLAQQGIAPAGRRMEHDVDAGREAQAAAHIGGPALLARALALRALARRLVTARKNGDDSDSGTETGTATGIGADLAALNVYLHAYLSAPQLEHAPHGGLALTRVARGNTVDALLGPVAEAVAQLLVEGDFALVKQCEHPDCVLWFYDRTKAHKRRWCSMALCGNRHKAAQFRKKNNA